MLISNSNNTFKQFRQSILDTKNKFRRYYLAKNFFSPLRSIVLLIVLVILYYLNLFYYIWNLEIPPAFIHSFNYVTHILPIIISTTNNPPAQSCAPCKCINHSSATNSEPSYGCIDDDDLEVLATSHFKLHGSAKRSTSGTYSKFFQDSLSTADCEKSLDSLHNEIVNNQDESDKSTSLSRKTLWHVYWRLDAGKNDLGYTPTTVLESWLATQDEDSVLIYWLAASNSLSDSRYEIPQTLLSLIRIFPNRIRYRFLDVALEAEGTPLQRSYLLRLHDSKAWIDSDIARLVIEYRYGGMYMDIDVLLLQDLKPLLQFEFVTEFSCDHSQSSANNAVMHIFRKSSSAIGLLEASKKIFPKLMSWAYGPDMLNSVTSGKDALQIWKLPWCFFHGVWCTDAIPMDALGGSAKWDRSFLDKVFGIHLHGAPKNGRFPHADSILAVYAKKHRQLLVEQVADSNTKTKELELYLKS
jgi:hypothetical protein